MRPPRGSATIFAGAISNKLCIPRPDERQSYNPSVFATEAAPSDGLNNLIWIAPMLHTPASIGFLTTFLYQFPFGDKNTVLASSSKCERYWRMGAG